MGVKEHERVRASVVVQVELDSKSIINFVRLRVEVPVWVWLSCAYSHFIYILFTLVYTTCAHWPFKHNL